MKKLLLLVIVAFCLSACDLITEETHDMYNDIPDTKIAIDTSLIQDTEENIPLHIYVTKEDTPVENADVQFTIWQAREAKESGTNYHSEYSEDGYYTVDVTVPNEGLFYIEATVTDGETTKQPTKYFTVGEIDMFEHMILDELVEDDELEIEGHH